MGEMGEGVMKGIEEGFVKGVMEGESCGVVTLGGHQRAVWDLDVSLTKPAFPDVKSSFAAPGDEKIRIEFTTALPVPNEVVGVFECPNGLVENLNYEIPFRIYIAENGGQFSFWGKCFLTRLPISILEMKMRYCVEVIGHVHRGVPGVECDK